MSKITKITNKKLDYFKKVQYNKYIKLKSARENYMSDSCSENFDKVRRLSDEFNRFNKVYLEKVTRRYK